MKKLSLRPYHGEVWLCGSQAEMEKAYRRLAREPYPYKDDPKGGRYIRLYAPKGGVRWLVRAFDTPGLAHEFAHVLLHTFGHIGHNPTEGDGEPFCYMLSQLLTEAAA